MYISELVAVLKSDVLSREVSIHGDAVWAVYDTPLQTDIDRVFARAYAAHSLVRTLNYKLEHRAIQHIEVGLGMSYGRALMIKAGYKGSGINEVVWMGDVVNEASRLAGYGNKTYFDQPLMVSPVFYGNLNEDNKRFLNWHRERGCYHGNVVDLHMDAWLQQTH